MNEESLLNRIASLMRAKDETLVKVGPGDDCAVLDWPAGAKLLATVDHLVEGRHFKSPIFSLTTLPSLTFVGTPTSAIARKAIARSVSDIAAMAGTPVACLATAAFPAGFPEPVAEELVDQFQIWGRHFNCPTVGGDLTSLAAGSACVFTVTALGVAHAIQGPVLRSGGKRGDLVVITGQIGGSLTSGRHLTFEPRIREGTLLAEALGSGLHAMMDISDGLGLDAARLARASNVAISIDASKIPLHRDVSDPVQACRDGEDYELLFTIDPKASLDRAREIFAAAGISTPLSIIGRVIEATSETPRCTLNHADTQLDISNLGWQHS